jgi:hypothetical protein
MCAQISPAGGGFQQADIGGGWEPLRHLLGGGIKKGDRCRSPINSTLGVWN